MINEYADLDAVGMASLVTRGEVSPLELVEQAASAVEKVNPRLNAVVHRMYDKARARAAEALPEGPLRGVPFVVKDLDGALAGEPYTLASRFLRDYVPDHDAEVIARLKRAGLVPIAKSNCPELGLLGVTEPALYGATRNPWNTGRTPGGSSGGSAALVAARAVPLGHGGDGGGSIRIPAAYCGLVGLKPTRARVPLGPDVGEGWGGYVQPGVLVRSVRDAAVALDVMAGPEEGAPYWAPPPARPFAQEVGTPPGRLIIAFTTRSLFGHDTHRDCIGAVEDAARLLEELGHTVVEAKLFFDGPALAEAYLTQIAASVAVELEAMAGWVGRRVRANDVEPATWFLGQAGRALSAADLERSRERCHAAARALAPFFRQHHVLLTATTAHPAAAIGELAPTGLEAAALTVLRAFPLRMALHEVLEQLAHEALERTPNTQLFNQTGHPAMSLPLHWSAEGMPLGVQLVARFGDEATLLRLAAQLEETRPWARRKPLVCA